ASLSWPPQHPAHRAPYRAIAYAVQEFLATPLQVVDPLARCHERGDASRCERASDAALVHLLRSARSRSVRGHLAALPFFRTRLNQRHILVRITFTQCLEQTQRDGASAILLHWLFHV